MPAPPLLAQQPTQKLPAPQHKRSTVAGFKKALKRAFFVGLFHSRSPDPLIFGRSCMELEVGLDNHWGPFQLGILFDSMIQIHICDAPGFQKAY